MKHSKVLQNGLPTAIAAAVLALSSPQLLAESAGHKGQSGYEGAPSTITNEAVKILKSPGAPDMTEDEITSKPLSTTARPLACRTGVPREISPKPKSI